MRIWLQIFYSVDDRVSEGGNGDDESFGDVWVLAVGIVFDYNSQKIHNINNSVFFASIDAKVGIDFARKLIDFNVAAIGD